MDLKKSVKCYTGEPGGGGLRDALRMELGPREGSSGCAGADMADSVRAIHHREAAHSSARDRGAAVAGWCQPVKHQVRGT